MDTYLMSDGFTEASADAGGPDQTAPQYVRSTLPPIWFFGASPAPRIFTSGRFNDFAISGFTTTTAPPPSVMTQQSNRCSGSEIIGEFTTSSTVTTSRRSACGLCWACCEAATLIHASCWPVVPNSCMCRIAHIAYWFTTVVPYGN